MRSSDNPRLHVLARLAVVALMALAVAATAGCTSPAASNTGGSGSTEATGAVQPSASTTATPKGAWPATVGTFAREFQKPVWYPTYLPAGYKLDTTYLIEFAPDGSLMCEVVFLNGDSQLVFDQGSPVGRDYEIVSTGKVAWGSAGDKADTMSSDTEDPEAPPMIVFSKDGNLMELQGDPSLDELKKVAAGMVLIK